MRVVVCVCVGWGWKEDWKWETSCDNRARPTTGVDLWSADWQDWNWDFACRD